MPKPPPAADRVEIGMRQPGRGLPSDGFKAPFRVWTTVGKDDIDYEPKEVAAKVDHGFDKTSAAELRKRLTPIIRKTQPYSKRIAHTGIWVESELLAEIEYRAKSADGKLRHPLFKGLREDL